MFNITEVVSRQFMLEIGVTDSVGQLVTFSTYMNVTALTCLPNPRNLYVRMDQEIDGVILGDFNCTNRYGLSYILQQYPAGTFAVNSATNGTALLILKASVVKIKFYSLSITITDGVDIAILKFKVIVQTKKCGIASGSTALGKALPWMILFSLQSFYHLVFGI
ncbi:uncharacterized protein LOC128548253 [Mercenaria mercenaria]|uniref:uncharacterized protein LOC128548253 n=1 Tax=Mercenaria mercenaria TaxID=6596 RepID=UPI00234EAE86|nr:uncharacterized protein LOC128548253 [Mercenaria mercenaria]